MTLERGGRVTQSDVSNALGSIGIKTEGLLHVTISPDVIHAIYAGDGDAVANGNEMRHHGRLTTRGVCMEIEYDDDSLAEGRVTTEPCIHGHHAYEWALAAALENPNLTDAKGRCIIPVDGVDYVTPEVGDPYIHVHTIFTMDANGEYVLTSGGMDVERTSIDLKIWKPAELTVEADD